MARDDFEFCLNFLMDESPQTILQWWQAAAHNGGPSGAR